MEEKIMYTNYLLTGPKTMKFIHVTKNNEVIFKESMGSIDEKEITRTVSKKKYQLVSVLTLCDITFAQCADATGTDWYNINGCEKILSLEKGDSVSVDVVAGEVFFKVVPEHEKNAWIYDAMGNLLAKESKDTNVVFSGSGPCLQKTNEKGKKILYTFEGYLVG